MACPWPWASSAALPSASRPWSNSTARPRAAGHDPAGLPVGINAHGYLTDTSQQAADEAYPPFAATMDRIGRERGWPPLTRSAFDAARTLRGANFVGSPQEVIDKILFQHELFHHDRFLLQISVGTLPHNRVMHAIELLGTRVAPVIRQATTPTTPSATPDSNRSAPQGMMPPV